MNWQSMEKNERYQRYFRALWQLNRIGRKAYREQWPIPLRMKIIRSKRKLRNRIQVEIFLFPKINHASIGLNPQVKGKGGN